jgi:sugar/nucleoside kinase (ribokinase family)
MPSSPAFLAVGHVTSDLIGGDEVLGGAALYASVQARALGQRARVLTACHRDWRGRKLLKTFESRQIPSAATTTFAYESVVGARAARLVALADPITPEELPEGWAGSEIALLCPVFREVDPAFADLLRPRLLAVAPQGWMRKIGEGGRVEWSPWDGSEPVLARASALFFSEEDAPAAEALGAAYAERVPIVVLTRGPRGATIWAEGARFEVPAVPAREVDPTGAGDVFAAAFLVARLEGAEAREAARFAAAAAACAVEAPGVGGIRGRAVIEARRRNRGSSV